eukprot:g2362.t1
MATAVMYRKVHRDVRGRLGLSFPIFNLQLLKDDGEGREGLTMAYTKEKSERTMSARIPILTDGRKLGVRTSSDGETALIITHARTGEDHTFIFSDAKEGGANPTSSAASVWVKRIIDAFESNGSTTRLGQHVSAGFREARFKIGGKQLVAQVPEACHNLSVCAKKATYSMGLLKTPACLVIDGDGLHVTLHLASDNPQTSPKNIKEARAKFHEEFSAYVEEEHVEFQQMDLLSCDEGCGYALLADFKGPIGGEKIFCGISGRKLNFINGGSAFFVVDFLHSVPDRGMATMTARKNAMVFACSLRVGSGTSRFPQENMTDPAPSAIDDFEGYSTSTSTESSLYDEPRTSVSSDDEELHSSPKLKCLPKGPPPPPPPTHGQSNKKFILKLKAIGSAAENAVSAFDVDAKKQRPSDGDDEDLLLKRFEVVKNTPVMKPSAAPEPAPQTPLKINVSVADEDDEQSESDDEDEDAHEDDEQSESDEEDEDALLKRFEVVKGTPVMELSAAPESLQESVSTTHASAQDDTEDVLLSELPGLPEIEDLM